MHKIQPRLLVIWGKHDLSFDLGEPERYRKDVPALKFTFWTPAILRSTPKPMKLQRWCATLCRRRSGDWRRPHAGTRRQSRERNRYRRKRGQAAGRSRVEIAIKLRLGLDNCPRTFLQVGLNLLERRICRLLQRNAIDDGS